MRHKTRKLLEDLKAFYKSENNMKNKSHSIEEAMLINLASSNTKVASHLNKVALASNHLNNASDILDDLGLESQAKILRNIVIKIAQNKLSK